MRHELPTYAYTNVMEPWTRLALGAPRVISLRLALLPWMWMTDPAKASRETLRMFSEKQDAMEETLMAIGQSPYHLWFDTMAALWGNAPHLAFANAMAKSSRRVARPSNSRVSANQRRLRN